LQAPSEKWVPSNAINTFFMARVILVQTTIEHLKNTSQTQRISRALTPYKLML
jgi:hypothetical protein